jgi:hypothetical protein
MRFRTIEDETNVIAKNRRTMGLTEADATMAHDCEHVQADWTKRRSRPDPPRIGLSKNPVDEILEGNQAEQLRRIQCSWYVRLA